MSPESTIPGRRLALAGGYLQIGPLIGAVGTAIGVIHSFNVLGAAGEADPNKLAQHIGEVLIYTGIGMVLGSTGLVLIGIALFTTSYRAPWIFCLLVLYGIIWLCFFPVGTLLGVVTLLYCFTHREEFRRSDALPKTVGESGAPE